MDRLNTDIAAVSLIGNIFNLAAQLPDQEIFEILHQSKHLKIERIISNGQITPEDCWYDQELDEWVILLQGEAEITAENGSVCWLKSGDYLFIPAHQKHRVTFTSEVPPCIWLALHFNSGSPQ